jgi:hypothetical protein
MSREFLNKCRQLLKDNSTKANKEKKADSQLAQKLFQKMKK